MADELKPPSARIRLIRGGRVDLPGARPCVPYADAFPEVAAAQRDRASLGKADVPDSNVVEDPSNLEVRAFTQSGALVPPYDFDQLAELYEASSCLRPNVDAYVTNIDGFGHRFEAVIDLTKRDADEKVADLIRVGRLLAKGEPKNKADLGIQGTPIDPTPAEVAAKRAEIELGMRLEKLRLDAFFDNVSPERSFVELRRMMREEKEVLGEAHWEVARDAEGRIARLNYVPGFTVRLLAIEQVPVEVSARVRGPDLVYREVTYKKAFHRRVQVFTTLAQPRTASIAGTLGGSLTVFFKEFGDPRVMSSNTGTYYATPADMAKKEPVARPATELITFKIHNQRYPYGVPRWIGALLPIWGTRMSEEVNFLYFDNKSIPPLALLVSGGQLSEESIKKMEDFIGANIKGRENFHKILILEGEAWGSGAPADSGRMKIDLRPLTDAQQKDALFKEYGERNFDIAGMAFRLPRLLRGDIRDFNRASAETAFDLAEKQVFGPERDAFDYFMDRRILSELGIRYWRFVSNGPSLRDPEQIIGMTERMLDKSAITPNEAREIIGEAFGREFGRIDEKWADEPVGSTAASLRGVDPGGRGEETDPRPGVQAAPAAPAPDVPAVPAMTSLRSRVVGR